MTGSPEIGSFPPISHPLTDHQYAAKLGEMETDRQAGMIIMRGVINTLKERGLIVKKPKIHKGWDVHVFLPRPEDSNRLIHFQLHTLRESLTAANVTVEEMKKEDLPEARKLASIGNEQTAVTKRFLNRRPVPFSQIAIVDLLEQVLKPQPTLPPKETVLVEFGQMFDRFIEIQSARTEFDSALAGLLEQRAVTDPSGSYNARLVQAHSVARLATEPAKQS